MAEPTILSFSPTPNEQGVVLGHLIEVVFDQPIDPATVNGATFALIGPGTSILLDADNLAVKNPRPVQSKTFITGTFSFPSPDRVVFTPDKPLQPKTEYTVTLAGGTSLMAQSVIKNPGGEKLARAYTWRFTTTAIADLTSSDLPKVSPLADSVPQIPVDQIRVLPRRMIGANLAGEIEIHFPAEIDPASLDPSHSSISPPDANPFNDVLVSLEAINNDPLIQLPEGIGYSVTMRGNVLVLQLTGLD